MWSLVLHLWAEERTGSPFCSQVLVPFCGQPNRGTGDGPQKLEVHSQVESQWPLTLGPDNL